MQNSIILSDIIQRIKDIKRLKSDAQVANQLNMTRNDLYGFQRRKTLPLKNIHDFCTREGIRLEYIINGVMPVHGNDPGPWPKIPGHGFGTRINNETQPDSQIVRELQPDYSSETPPDILLQQTAKVLHTKSVYKDALDSNIKAFHAAVEMQEELNITKAKLAQCIDLINKQQVTIQEQKHEMEDIKTEFQQEIHSLKEAMNTMQDRLKSMDGG